MADFVAKLFLSFQRAILIKDAPKGAISNSICPLLGFDSCALVQQNRPDSEVAECSDDFRFLGYSGLVVLTASLSESDPKRKSQGTTR
jgi:hypothetical protein